MKEDMSGSQCGNKQDMLNISYDVSNWPATNIILCGLDPILEINTRQYAYSLGRTTKYM